MLADMQTEVEAARSLMYRAAWMVDAGKNAMNEINMAKLFASEVYVKVANLGMQIYGGNGYSMEYPMQRHYRDSRIATVARTRDAWLANESNAWRAMMLA